MIRWGIRMRFGWGNGWDLTGGWIRGMDLRKDLCGGIDGIRVGFRGVEIGEGIGLDLGLDGVWMGSGWGWGLGLELNQDLRKGWDSGGKCFWLGLVEGIGLDLCLNGLGVGGRGGIGMGFG